MFCCSSSWCRGLVCSGDCGIYYFLVIFVCIVFEQGDKMLTLSSMDTLIVESNLQHCMHNGKILAFSCQKCEFSEFYECLCIIEFIKLVKKKQ